jgi:hypothetical protein
VGKKMRKTVLAALAFLLCASISFADQVDEGLPDTATTEVKAGARHMIRAGIKSEDAVRMTRVMLEHLFSNQNIIRAQEIIMRATREGLPVEPIINKSYEGMAKRVHEANIILAMEKVMKRYAFAYQQACKLTQDKVRRSHIMEEVAECVAAGITENDVDRLVYQLDYRVRETPMDDSEGLATETFRTVKEVARQRVPSMLTADMALYALKNQYDAKKMISMRQSFMKHTRDTSAQTVADVYSDTIRQGKRLEALDFSNIKAKGKGRGGGGSGGSEPGDGGSGSGGAGAGVGGTGGGQGMGTGGQGGGRR